MGNRTGYKASNWPDFSESQTIGPLECKLANIWVFTQTIENGQWVFGHEMRVMDKTMKNALIMSPIVGPFTPLTANTSSCQMKAQFGLFFIFGHIFLNLSESVQKWRAWNLTRNCWFISVPNIIPYSAGCDSWICKGLAIDNPNCFSAVSQFWICDSKILRMYHECLCVAIVALHFELGNSLITNFRGLSTEDAHCRELPCQIKYWKFSF